MAEAKRAERWHGEPASAAEDPAGKPHDAVTELRRPPGEAESPVAPETKESSPSSTPEPARAKRNWRRTLLLALLPVALAAGSYSYVTGGQIMSTDNAYVRADTVGVSTDVAGTVVSVEVHDNEPVRKGQVLYRLNPEPFQIALDGAKAQLGTVHDQVLTLQATYKLALAQVDQAEADLDFYQTNFNRQRDLLARGAGTQAAFDVARHDLEATQKRIAVAKAQAETSLAQLSDDPNQKIEDNPFYKQAKSSVDNAQRDLNDTIVRAPFDGLVTNVNAIQPGSYLQASQPAFSLVSSSHVWIEANPKETELTYVRAGQEATVTVDAYPGVEWKGVIDSLSPASGSSFSLLPAQNTTGNWVKVVQRIPLRVRVDDTAGKPTLRVGMSVTVDIDTGHARGMPEFIAQWFGHDDKRHG